MRSPSVPVTLAVLALAAAPAASARSALSIEPARLVPSAAAHLTPAAKKESRRSCQAGASRSRVRAAGETERRSSTVACEQPPRSNLNLSGALKAAQAAAVAAAG